MCGGRGYVLCAVLAAVVCTHGAWALHPILPVGISTARRRSALGLRLVLLGTLKPIELATLGIMTKWLLILGQVM